MQGSNLVDSTESAQVFRFITNARSFAVCFLNESSDLTELELENKEETQVELRGNASLV